jgi:HD-GYP domain-containing protein (c-di-GMP phosphodiesterase class II)
VSSEILQAPRKLTDDEFQKIKAHTIYGYEILNKCKFSSNQIKLTAWQHHEKLDGSGYPNRVSDISRMAQIIGLIDCYEALTNDDRPYRDSMAALKALTLLKDDVVAGKYSRRIFEKFAYSLI